jgi:peroxiredoxin
MFQRNCFTILLIGYCSVLFAQPAVVTGIIPGGENHEIRLMTLGDHISFKPILSDRTIVSSSGHFTLTAEIEEQQVAKLEIGFYSANIFIIPGKQYNIICDSIRLTDEFRPFYLKDALFFEIIEEPEPRLNHWLSLFENRYYTFVSDQFETFSKKRDPAILEAFRSEMQEEFGMITDAFFTVYVDYKIATLELSASPSRKNTIFKKYLHDRTVYYNNPEYMFFFNTFFDHYLPGNNRFITRRDLNATINDQANYTALMDTLGKDTLLRNEVIRELVLLKTLKELYPFQSFSSANILLMLEQVAVGSKFSEHREIARNIKDEICLLAEGVPAPPFKLPSLDGDTISLADLRGKPVYLFFMTTQSHGSLVEFARMDELYKIYGNDIHFVTVSFDETMEIIDRFREKSGFNWLFLFNGSRYDLIHKYRMKTYPTFVLIDSSGNIAEYPAYKPSEIIEDSFQRLLK